MDKSVVRRAIIIFLFSLSILALLEWIINGDIKLEHVLGWSFVALFIAALSFVLNQKT